ncbi:MAG: YiiD C-terminal domain-containing protein [Syntrophaceae bacterium]|nr:YiiD C-terminal domain-containing protein [Syntrophaceae bacterium]
MIEKKYEEHVGLLESIVRIIAAMGIRIVEMRDRHVKVLLPLEPNINHIGTMYAGSLFTVGEFIGGAIFIASFDYTRFYPIVKAINIQYRRPATTSVTVEAILSEEEINAIQQEAEAKGKADWKMDLEIKDEAGEVCCLVQGVWQMRKGGN